MNNLKKYRVSSNAYPNEHEGRIVIAGGHVEDYRCIYDINKTMYLGLMHKDNLDLIVNEINTEDRVVIMKSGRYGKIKSHENDWLIVEMEDSPIPEVVSEDEICDADFWDSWEKPESTISNRKAAAIIIFGILLSLGIWAGFYYMLTVVKERNKIEYRAIDNRSGARSTER